MFTNACYDDGHAVTMRDGFAYVFGAGPEYYDRDGSGQRAVLRRFQTYPQNSVQGGGTLVFGSYDDAGNPCPGSAFRETQPAQLMQDNVPIESDILGGGIDANGFGWQPLVSGNQ